MFKLGKYLLIALLAWNLCEVSQAESENYPEFRCVLKNPEDKCQGFCFSRLRRLAYHINLHEQKWKLRYAGSLNGTQERLDRMELQEANIESHVVEILSTLEVIRESRQN